MKFSFAFNETPLQLFLTRVRQRFLWLSLLNIFSSLALFFLIFGAAIFPLFWFYPPKISLQFLGVFLFLAAFLYLVGAFYRLWRRAQDEVLCRQIEEWAPETYGFFSAVELEKEFIAHQKSSFSPDLLRARIKQTESKVAHLDPIEFIPSSSLHRKARLLLLLSILFWTSLLVYPNRFSKIFHSILFPKHHLALSLFQHQKNVSLLVSDLNVSYTYPDYTHLPPRHVPNSDGSLTALKGTKVVLQGIAIFPVNRGELLINDQERIPLQLGKEARSLTARFTLLQGGFYRFQLVDREGRLKIGPPHTIQIRKDRYPRVILLTPKKDLQVKERDKLLLRYKFSDDFGISKVSLVFRNLTRGDQKESVQPIRSFRKMPRAGKKRWLWDLSTMPFGPNDKIAYQIEVFDNDVISGPKRTRSIIRYITIRSPLHEHEKLIASQEKLLVQLVHLLGDFIEYPNIVVASEKTKPAQKCLGAWKKVETRQQKIIQSFQKLIKALREDPLTKPYTLIALENLFFRHRLRARRLYQLFQIFKTMPNWRPCQELKVALKRVITPEEADVYAMSLLINRQQLDLIAELSRKLTRSQNRLNELLARYRRHKTKALKRQLLREMRRMEHLIRQIMARMNKLNRQIPDEYLNMDAFKKRNSLRTIQQMRKSVEKDDIEKAAKELSRLAKQVEEMSSQMERYSREAGGRGVQKMSQALKKMTNELQQLAMQEQKLMRYTEELRRKILKRMQSRLKMKLRKLIERQLRYLRQIRHHHQVAHRSLGGRFVKRYHYGRVFEEQGELIDELEQLLKQPDLYEAVKRLEKLNNKNFFLYLSLRSYRRNLTFYLKLRESKRLRRRMLRIKKSLPEIKAIHPIIRKMLKELRKSMPSLQSYMNQRERRTLRRQRMIQRNIRRRSKRLLWKMRRIGRKIPIFSPQMLRSMKQAISQMRWAESSMRRSRLQQAHSHENKALSHLKALRQSLRRTMQPQKGKGGKRGYASYREEEKVKIPKGHDQAPKALRQDILKAMKEKVPPKYKEPVRRYYEKLVK